MMGRIAGFLLLAGLAFLGAGVALLPMRLVLDGARLDQAGLAAADVSGTVWNAKLTQARFRGTELGTLRLGLSPLSVVSGSLALRFSLSGAREASGKGALLLLRQPGLEKVTASVPLDGLSPSLPLRGALRLSGVSFRFAGQRCLGAAGRISTDALGASAASLGWQGPDLEGPVTCVGKEAVAELTGEREGVRVRARLVIDSTGLVKLDSTVSGVDANGEVALGAAGFAPSSDGWTRTDQGRL